jgi:putative hydrolase of the HAD superfamily
VRREFLSVIRAIFWDVGGVLLTNAWDHDERKQALQHFHLEEDEKEFQARHELVVSSFERGKTSLDEYLDHTVFYRERPFSRQEFREYMYSLSKPRTDILNFARLLREAERYLMATINNESRELNLYRVDKFRLRDIFQLFLSSCFVGLRKPESSIFRLALGVTQIEPASCCFIDDRGPNLEPAAALGMRTVQMQNLEQLRRALENMGVTAGTVNLHR